VPSWRPTALSFRYSAAHNTSPVSIDSGVEKMRFETPPLEVITTTIATFGWSRSTSTCRTVADSSGGAETSARSLVASESISVVCWSADSISFCRASSSPRAEGRGSGSVRRTCA
jgi:hypothetical protein